MIVNYTESGWEIITQRSHGLLAAQICAHWKKNDQPERWVDTLIATAEHDDVYNEFENEDLLNPSGGPINFNTTSFKKEYADRLIAMAETKSAYIALLITRHILFVHGPDPKAASFIKALREREKKWIHVAQSSKEEVRRGYELLEFCDAFSLLICQQQIQPEQRKIEISSGPDGTAYEMHAVGEGLKVNPWPFEETSFVVSYESRILPQLAFKSTAEFRKMIADAEVKTHHLRLKGM